ncbi:DUF3619 family protein [Azohydromonas caseinilytica]|uniref:DUF3619 family protein n=1 Tax=Azohydromonas caseinilytica TaxID=2728836 RepID=A0A848F6P1_9BURK|nr:DUF3619 family protein [Azohydromonas caseinilytica]NML14229.1 DUF3619 family protein [Azohydromonas caseinilytica]
MNDSRPLTTLLDAQALEARFALRVTARLSERASHQPHAIEERLRFARQQALERARARRKPAPVTAPSVQVVGSTLALGGGGPQRSSWWERAMATALPLAVLLGGLALIQWNQTHAEIEAAVQIDAELLVDDLPPTAYSDPGFVEFLRKQQDR